MLERPGEGSACWRWWLGTWGGRRGSSPNFFLLLWASVLPSTWKSCLHLAGLEAWCSEGGIYATWRERLELNCFVIWQFEWVMLSLGYQEASYYSVFSWFIYKDNCCKLSGYLMPWGEFLSKVFNIIFWAWSHLAVCWMLLRWINKRACMWARSSAAGGAGRRGSKQQRAFRMWHRRCRDPCLCK